MLKTVNNTHIEGYVYEHKLEKKVSGETSKNPGTEFITGTLGIATDDDMLNVVQVHFTYVTPVTAKGKPNATYNVLNAIIDGKIGNVMANGKDEAGKVRIDSAIGLNEWFDSRNDGALISVKRNEGGFIHQTVELDNNASKRATFETDMLITGTRRIEADPERNTPEKVIVKGYIFDFRQAILPVEFSVCEPYATPKALDYFEGLEASEKNPVFTKVQGVQISQTVIRQITEESAFGEAMVKEVKSSQRDYVITWAAANTYEWDSEEGILATELAEKVANREVYLADIKTRQEEYQANKGNALAGGTAATTTKGSYNF